MSSQKSNTAEKLNKQIEEQNLEQQVEAIEKKQNAEDQTYSSAANSAKSLENPKINRQPKEREESFLIYFRSQICNTEVSSKMQKQYENLLQAGLRSYDSDQLVKIRRIFADEQVVTAYLKFLPTRILPRPKEFELLKLDEQIGLLLQLAEQVEIVETHGYPLALELFALLARKQTFQHALNLSPLQKSFISKSIVLAFEEVENISSALLEVFLAANLIPELIQMMENKNLFEDKASISKHWSFGKDKYPANGLDKGTYRLMHVIKAKFMNLTLNTLISVLGNQFTYRTEVLQMLDRCAPTLQERVVHLLVSHTEYDETIKHSISLIVRALQQNPSSLDFCKACEAKGKLNVNGILTLVDYLKSETKESIARLMQGTYWEAYNKLNQERNARCKDGINSTQIQAYVEKLKQENQNVFTNFSVIENASQTLAQANPLYKHSLLQTAVACYMYQPESCAILSRAGTGKTNMILILCRQLLNEGKAFAIVVANEYLYHQMYHDTKQFFPDEEIDVIQIDYLDVQFTKGKILILDEADAMIDNNKILIKPESKSTIEIGGLIAAAQAQRLILLSATFASHHRQFMRQVLGIKTEKIHEFKNAAQLNVNSDSNELNCTKLVFQKLSAFASFNKPFYQTIATQKPIICFIEEKDVSFEHWLETLARESGVPYYIIETIEQAKQYREALKQSKTGVMLISSKFARGFDLKMAQDGFGLVIANGTKLKPNAICQMFGRTNRSQGEPDGCLVMIDAKIKTDSEAWQMIKARDKSEPTYGFANLALLCKNKHEITGASFNLIKTAFGGVSWQISEHEFKKSNFRAVQLLQGQSSQKVDRHGSQPVQNDSNNI